MVTKRGSGIKRVSGVLLPLASLPGPDGIGDLGRAAYRFIDWLRLAGQRRWQILPLSIPDSTGSPYASLSGQAGNWLLISSAELKRNGLLPSSYPSRRAATPAVSYRRVFRTKWQMVRASYRYFTSQVKSGQPDKFRSFCKVQARWLDDFILFQALKDRHQQRPWWTWEAKWRRPRLARRHLDSRLKRQMQLHAYAQWLWAVQWAAVRRYANRRGIKIIGDLPFFVRHDSVDVWAHPELFLINQRGQPTAVAGAPPDSFNRAGQRWGFPLYDWPAHCRTGFHWWAERFRRLNSQVDIIRVDHFRGLGQTWQMAWRSTNARRGRWVPSPGQELLRTVKRHLPRLDLIAEDLGSTGAGADDLRRAFHIPTIRVLLFGWSGLPNNYHHHTEIKSDVVYYTANHDTNTTVGWWRDEAKPYERQHLRERLGQIIDPAWQSIALTMATPAQLTVMPAQDVLRLGSSARLNRPGGQRGNWSWRLRSGQLTVADARRLRELTHRYGRG